MRISNAFKAPIINTKTSKHQKKPGHLSYGESVSKSGDKKRKYKTLSRPNFSESEIRSKIENHNKSKNIKKTQVEHTPTHDSEAVNENESIEDEELVVGDVKKNNPDDPLVKEKLRGILKGGGFNFNMKTKKVLAGILNQDENS